MYTMAHLGRKLAMLREHSWMVPFQITLSTLLCLASGFAHRFIPKRVILDMRTVQRYCLPKALRSKKVLSELQTLRIKETQCGDKRVVPFIQGQLDIGGPYRRSRTRVLKQVTDTFLRVKWCSLLMRNESSFINSNWIYFHTF
jgi:hypothetical protein